MIQHPEKSRELTPSTTPTIKSSLIKLAMNLSQSDHVYGPISSFRNSSNDAGSGMERVEASSPPTSGMMQTPTQLIKRLMPRSWHGEKTHSGSSKEGTPPPAGGTRKTRNAIPAPPLESPGTSESTIRNIVAPRFLSPTTPGKTPIMTPGAVAKVNKPTSALPLLVSPGESSGRKKRSSSLLHKLSSGSNHLIKEVTVPSIYKYARKCQWDDFSRALSSSTSGIRDIGYVYKKDGTTVLHMAVMSRTGYINAFKSSAKDFPMAPLEVVEELLQLDPDAAKIKCTLNGYTPLTYACLVCHANYNVEDAASMVRLFLKYCPESIHLFTKEGLSPVDIHVVSYSHHHQTKEEESSLGRTSASVLRTLLTHSPELANNRLRGDKVKGPIELLYKCNAKAFSKAVMDEIYDADEEGTVRSDYTIPERRQKAVDTVKKWWIWTWAVMILKYGSLKQKKRGAQFAAVHSASMQQACPTPLLSLTMYAFPRQIKQPSLDKDDLESLPLHAVCSWPSGPRHKSASQSLVATRKSQAISRVIEEYPLAVKVTNGMGETALELAAKTGTTWDGGVRRLVKAYPKALRWQSKQTGLYPFMTAAAVISTVSSSSSEEREAQALRTVYGLLRSNPKVLIHSWQNGQK